MAMVSEIDALPCAAVIWSSLPQFFELPEPGVSRARVCTCLDTEKLIVERWRAARWYYICYSKSNWKLEPVHASGEEKRTEFHGQLVLFKITATRSAR